LVTSTSRRPSYDKVITELGIRSVVAGDTQKAAQRVAAAAAAAAVAAGEAAAE
jgi:hypothetical protein